MLVGKPPFTGATQYLTLQAVKEANLSFPDDMDETAKDLISKLLQSVPEERLGAENLDDLKSHKFFATVDWENIHTCTPPKMP